MPSTVIAGYTYNADAKILSVLFVSGKIYDYKDVPEDVYTAMRASRSKGIFFNRNIRDVYEYELVQEENSKNVQ